MGSLGLAALGSAIEARIRLIEIRVRKTERSKTSQGFLMESRRNEPGDEKVAGGGEGGGIGWKRDDSGVEVASFGIERMGGCV